VDDIPLLVEYFVDRYAQKAGKKFRDITSKTLALFQRYHWPGNIRELQNVIERAVIISTGPALRVDVTDLKLRKAGLPTEEPASPKLTNGTLHDVLKETQRQQILKALKECKWIVSGPDGAAAHLGMKRSTLQLRMHKLGIARGSA
jgi:formate hydrogenlyase transcriptional activator